MSESDYQPVSCDYHDQLEAAAMHKQTVELEFDEEGTPRTETGTIADVFTREGAEYVTVQLQGDSLEIRLDRILSIKDIG